MEIEKNVEGHVGTVSESSEVIPAGGQTVVSEGEARPDVNASPESYTDQGPLTAEKLMEKAKKFKKASSDDKTPPPAKDEAAPKAKDDEPGKASKEAGKAAPKTPEEGKPALEAGKDGKDGAKFTPNPKFSALGKEYEVPKFLMDKVTSPEQEKEIKEVYEKALGLDHVKMRHQELYQKHTELEGAHTEIVGGIEELRSIYSNAVQTGNLLRMDDFFERLKIPPQVIMNYALQRAQFEELPEEQKQIVVSQIQSQRRSEMLEKQNQNLSSNVQSSESRALNLELNSVLARAEVAQAVQAFDSTPGRKSGDFFNRVKERGEYTYYKSQGKKILSAEEAVKEVLSMYGQAPAQGSPQASPTPAQVPAGASLAPQVPPVVPAPHRDVPTIPTIAGKSSSPTKQKIRSIEDLKKIRKEMVGG